jgi:FK506-binding protein 1
MGVTKEILSAGDEKTYPSPGDTVTVHYIGTLAKDGTKFDSSRDRGQEFSTEIGVGKVIKGWDEGVLQMCEGEKALLKITSDCAFGAQGAGENIVPPDADVHFEVELIKVTKKTAEPSE